MPKITVLMPVYNAEKFLASAIESILNQTFRDFDFLIIDDGSTDRSVDIIRSYSDARIRFYINEHNMGISGTLNKGIGLAETELIARMDADDISYPERLEKQVGYMMANPDCALVSSLVRVISEEGEFIRQDNFKSDEFYYNLTFICWIYHPSVMYRKKAVIAAGLYSEVYSEDFELFWQIIRQFKFYNLPEALLAYRITSQSLHQVLKKKEYKDAQQKQLMRNFRYYAGDNYILPVSYIECLQHNFGPLLAKQSVHAIIGCIKELDFLSEKIIGKENINRDIDAIKRAAASKRAFIIAYFSQQLPVYKSIALLARLRQFKQIVIILKALLLEGVNRK